MGSVSTELRQAVLQAAMQGKLTEQLATDGFVNLSLLNTKKHSKIVDELDIPDNWINVHLEDITNSISTKQYQILDSQIQKTGMYPVISQSKQYVIGYSDLEDKVLKHSNKLIAFGDHTTVVKIIDFAFIVGADGVKLIESTEDIIPEYLYCCMLFNASKIADKGGYSRHYKFIKNVAIPLPPLAEQYRIVARVEELMAKIDELEVIENNLRELHQAFPNDMKASLLQSAIQGKLTEQLPEDGDARDLLEQIKSEKERLIKEKKITKEKALSPITDDDIPFDIPDNWVWCKTKDISQICTGKRDANFGSVDGVYPFFTCASKPINCCSYSFDCDAILLAGNGDFNNINMYSGKFEAYQRTYVVTPFNSVMLKYLYYCFKARWVQSNFKKSYGSVISYVRLGNVENFVIPLPPPAEQERIVEKLDRLLPLCDSIPNEL